jgi:hypothetical protein
LPNLSFESIPPSSDELFDWLEYEAVIFTPNADLDLTARVKITNKDFGFFEIRMIIIFAEIGGNI